MKKAKIICSYCGGEFERRAEKHKWNIKNNRLEYCDKDCLYSALRLKNIECEQCGRSFHPSDATRRFCSKVCWNEYNSVHMRSLENKFCKQCGNEFRPNECGRKFCSRPCAGRYNQAHKTTTYKVSKLEKFLQQELPKKFRYKFIFNSRSILGIGTELDIYTPALKIACEINGPTHYLPIYGLGALLKVQKRDKDKKRQCKILGIKLYIINVSLQTKVTTETSTVFLNRIIKFIKNIKIARD